MNKIRGHHPEDQRKDESCSRTITSDQWVPWSGYAAEYEQNKSGEAYSGTQGLNRGSCISLSSLMAPLKIILICDKRLSIQRMRRSGPVNHDPRNRNCISSGVSFSSASPWSLLIVPLIKFAFFSCNKTMRDSTESSIHSRVITHGRRWPIR